MPLYDYRCEGGHEYELTEGFHAPTEHPCPKCGRQSRRQISLPAVIFKGSGFYSTDNRKSGGSDGRSNSSDTASKDNGHSHDGDHGHSHESTPKVEAAAE
ncbi:MAG TPA: FmdB family zinc ribbon protein [Dehalococcoidia bacterium]|nr:FmdB family zinc ribbon protein [Dehalococcoidia bacterium]